MGMVVLNGSSLVGNEFEIMVVPYWQQAVAVAEERGWATNH